jgi:hypothetical protein
MKLMPESPGFRAAAWPLATFGKSTKTVTETMMIDETLTRLRVHRNNIHRYRRLLATRLTELERGYIERRLQEEQSAMDALSAEMLPFTLPAARSAPQAAA